MLLSAKDQGLGRRRPRSYSHNHVYSLHKMARPSKVSLLSTTTTQSSGSNGSNSTVTQESYNKAKDESSKKKRPTRRKKETLRPKTPLMEAVQETNEAEQHAEKLSVFAFLVDEEAVEDHEDATEEVPLLTDKPLNEGESHVSEASPDTTSPSDSGISMDDRSFVLDKTISRPLLPDTDIESAPDYHIFLEQPTTRSTLTWPEIPRAQSTAQPQTYAQAHVQELPRLAGSYPEQIAASSLPRCTPSSPSCHISTPDTYDAIAAKLDSAGRNGCEVPFRSFQRSNYRLLFRLQDEIADLEKELDHFDELCCSDYAPDQSEGSGWDSSRRPSWHHKQYRMGMEAAGAEMTAKLDGKLEQYCKHPSSQISSRWTDHQLQTRS